MSHEDDTPDVAVLNESDGAKILVTKAEDVEGVTASGAWTTEFPAAPNGALMRFLANGHL